MRIFTRTRDWFWRERPWMQWRWRITVGVLLLLTLDVMQQPQSQVSAKAYVSCVKFYKSFLSPSVSTYTTCRYHPTCSIYSIEAVEKHGMVYGGWLTCVRLVSCNPMAEMGTDDPVP